MSLHLLAMILVSISFIAALLPVIVYRDSNKPLALVIINLIILFSLFAVGALTIFPDISMRIHFSPIVLLPVIFVLSLIGFILETSDKKKRGQSFKSAMWSTSFPSLIFCSYFIIYFIIGFMGFIIIPL